MQLIIKKFLIIILSIVSFQTVHSKLYANEKYEFVTVKFVCVANSAPALGAFEFINVESVITISLDPIPIPVIDVLSGFPLSVI